MGATQNSHSVLILDKASFNFTVQSKSRDLNQQLWSQNSVFAKLKLSTSVFQHRKTTNHMFLPHMNIVSLIYQFTNTGSSFCSDKTYLQNAAVHTVLTILLNGFVVISQIFPEMTFSLCCDHLFIHPDTYELSTSAFLPETLRCTVICFSLLYALFMKANQTPTL